MTATRAGAVTNVAQRRFGNRQKLSIAPRQGLQSHGASRRERQQVAGLIRRCRVLLDWRLGRLLHDDVSVGATEAERADASYRRTAFGRPRPGPRLHANREFIERYMRIGLLEVQARRNLRVL